jgi:transposase
MIQEDTKRCLELDEKVKTLETKIREVAKDSKIAKLLLSIPGFGPVCTTELGACLSNRHFFIDVAEELCFL